MNNLNLVIVKKTRGVLVSLVPLLASTSVLANDNQNYTNDKLSTSSQRGLGMRRHMLKHMTNTLDLSAAQKEQIKLIAQQAKTENSDSKALIKLFEEGDKALMFRDFLINKLFITISKTSRFDSRHGTS